MRLSTFSRLRQSLATSALYVAVRIPEERFLLYRKAISCKVKKLRQSENLFVLVQLLFFPVFFTA